MYELSRREIVHDGVHHICVDITDESNVLSAVRRIVNKHKRIDLLINCAGFGISGAIEFTDLSDAKRQFDVNFFGMVNVNKAVLPYMRQIGCGRIVNISSVAAIASIPFQAYYSASKAAIESYTCALANEVRPFGITVTCIQPGDIRTAFTQSRNKSAVGDDVYGGRISKSVAKMEKDEQNGMSPEVAGKSIRKIAFKKHVKLVYTLGFGYKCLSLLIKFMPCNLRNWIIGLLYAK